MGNDWRYLDENSPSKISEGDLFQVLWNGTVMIAKLVFDNNGRDCYFENKYGNSIVGHVKYREDNE